MSELIAPPSRIVQAVPSDRLWFDPGLLNVATYPQFTDIELAAAVVRPLVVPNPRRWALGFGGITGLVSLSMSPWPDVSTMPFVAAGGAIAVPFFTLFSHGPLVSNGWWGVSTALVTIRTVELLRV